MCQGLKLHMGLSEMIFKTIFKLAANFTENVIFQIVYKSLLPVLQK